MTSRIVVIPDMQIPDHDAKAINAVMQFVEEYEPDELFCVGDESDSPEPSRWNKGYAAEYAGTFQAGLDLTATVMRGFREALGDKPFHVQRSNHTDRVSKYIHKYAPALAGLRELEYERLVGYHEIDVKFHREIYKFAPGWAMAHGDEGSMSPVAGSTAMSLARRTGMSIVCGHTHKAGIQHSHDAYNGRISRRLWGVETGHLMDLSKASYLSSGGANWQQSFVILYIDKGKVHPHLVPIIDKQFVVEGATYSWN